MNQWIIRQGLEKRAGQYLWEAEKNAWDWTMGGGGGVGIGIGTIGGGTWKSSGGWWLAEWDAKQGGALVYTDRRLALRIAKKVGGRVVRLRPKYPATGVQHFPRAPWEQK